MPSASFRLVSMDSGLAGKSPRPGMTCLVDGSPSRIHLRDELRVEIGIERVRTALAAEAGVLDAAEAHFRQRQAVVVDRHHAAFDGVADSLGGLGRARIRVGGEA